MDDEWVERAASRCSDPVIVYRVMMKQLTHRFEQLKIENDQLKAEVRALRVQHQRDADSRLATSPMKGGNGRRCASAACRKPHAAAHDTSTSTDKGLNSSSGLPSRLTSPSKLMPLSSLSTPARLNGTFTTQRAVSTAGTNTSPIATPRPLPAEDLPRPSKQLFDMMIQTTPRNHADSAVSTTGGSGYQGLVRSTHHVQTEVTPPRLPEEERPAMCLPNSSTSVVLTTLLRHLLLLLMQDDRVVAGRGAATALPKQIDVGGKEVSRLLEAVIGMVIQLKRRVVAAAADAARHIEAAAMPQLVGTKGPAKGSAAAATGLSGAGVAATAASPLVASFDRRVPLPMERQLLQTQRSTYDVPPPSPPHQAPTFPAGGVAPLSVLDLLNSSPNGKSQNSAAPESTTVFSTLCGDREMREYEQWREDFSRRVMTTTIKPL